MRSCSPGAAISNRQANSFPGDSSTQKKVFFTKVISAWDTQARRVLACQPACTLPREWKDARVTPFLDSNSCEVLFTITNQPKISRWNTTKRLPIQACTLVNHATIFPIRKKRSIVINY